MRTDFMTMRLLALMADENARVIERLLTSPDIADGHARGEMILPAGYAERHGIVYAGITSEHHGDRLASHLIFGRRITWHDGSLMIPEQMPDTRLQALRQMSLHEMTGSDIFDDIGIEAVEQTGFGVSIITDVESLITVVDADGSVKICRP